MQNTSSAKEDLASNLNETCESSYQVCSILFTLNLVSL